MGAKGRCAARARARPTPCPAAPQPHTAPANPRPLRARARGAGDSAVVVATFFGIVHELSIGSAECGRLLSVRKSDGDRVPVAFAHEAACELRESGGDGRARAK